MTFEEWKPEATRMYHNSADLPSVPNFLQWCWNTITAAQRKELQPCDHPTPCIGADATERGGQWDYEMAMRLYNEQQRRACEAEAEVARLREALELAEQCATNGDGRCLNCGKFLSSGHKDECCFQAISTPADDWLVEQHDAEVRREERAKSFRTVAEIIEYYYPEDEPFDGHKLAQRLLDEFRAAIREG